MMMMTNNRFVVAVVAVLSFVACPAAAQFYYTDHGSTNANGWTGLCDTGLKQSPVDLSTATTAASLTNATIELTGSYSAFAIEQTGHNILITPSGSDGAYELVYGARTFKLTNYQFHAQSEHTVGADRKAMEVQFLFTSTTSATDFAKMSFLFDSTSAAQSQVLPGVTLLSELSLTNSGPTIPSQTNKDYEMFSNFLTLTRDTNKSSLLTYEGSDTMPACLENTIWFVWTTPLKLNSAVYGKLTPALMYPGLTGGTLYENYRMAKTTPHADLPKLTWATTIPIPDDGSAASAKTFGVVAVAAVLAYFM
eukprot:Lankesteria_metandrocarpae@DN5403_c0_g2_i1.p1